MAILDDVRQAMRIRTNAYDTELQIYIDTCIYDLKRLNLVVDENNLDSEIRTAIILFVKTQFGTSDVNYKVAMKQSYADLVDRLRVDVSKKVSD